MTSTEHQQPAERIVDRPGAKGAASKPAIGARPTRQRRAVVDALAAAEVFHSAQEIHAQLERRRAQVGLTTVYRTLQALAELGEVDVLVRGDGETVYRRCSAGHHHHLVCRSCGRTVEIEGPAVEAWARRTAQEHGFAQVEHTLEIFGVCADCAGQAL
ncbi:MAG TPA: Fur family transcriptional regulator [Nocardioidaceae bacterium]|nr:Fur family transcriptional regulator [Nocardioidaceae bacterium]